MPILTASKAACDRIESVAIGIRHARERMRTALCKLHDDGSGPGLYLEATERERKDIEIAVDAFIRDDEVLSAIDRELEQAFAEAQLEHEALREVAQREDDEAQRETVRLEPGA